MEKWFILYIKRVNVCRRVYVKKTDHLEDLNAAGPSNVAGPSRKKVKKSVGKGKKRKKFVKKPLESVCPHPSTLAKLVYLYLMKFFLIFVGCVGGCSF